VGVLGKRNRHRRDSASADWSGRGKVVVGGCSSGDDDDDEQLAASGRRSLRLQVRAGLRAECR
jgi:hypothetical protein